MTVAGIRSSVRAVEDCHDGYRDTGSVKSDSQYQPNAVDPRRKGGELAEVGGRVRQRHKV